MRAKRLGLRASKRLEVEVWRSALGRARMTPRGRERWRPRLATMAKDGLGMVGATARARDAAKRGEHLGRRCAMVATGMCTVATVAIAMSMPAGWPMTARAVLCVRRDELAGAPSTSAPARGLVSR